jgi:hypothetical protein
LKLLIFSPTSSSNILIQLWKPSRKERRSMSQKCEADTSYILLDPTSRTTLKADEEFGELQI